MKGFLTICRTMFDSKYWTAKREYSRFEALLWLYVHARFSKTATTEKVGSLSVTVGRGELLTNLNSLQKVWSWNTPARVKRFLKELEKLQWVEIKKVQSSNVAKFWLKMSKYEASNELQDFMMLPPQGNNLPRVEVEVVELKETDEVETIEERRARITKGTPPTSIPKTANIEGSNIEEAIVDLSLYKEKGIMREKAMSVPFMQFYILWMDANNWYYIQKRKDNYAIRQIIKAIERQVRTMEEGKKGHTNGGQFRRNRAKAIAGFIKWMHQLSEYNELDFSGNELIWTWNKMNQIQKAIKRAKKKAKEGWTKRSDWKKKQIETKNTFQR